MPNTQPPDCPACGVKNMGGDVGHDLFRCFSCDHIFQHPPEITAVYDQKYISDRYDTYDTATISYLRMGFLQAIAPPPAKIIDIGYGNGAFIHAASKAGYNAFGSDVHGCGEKYNVRDVSIKDNSSWDVALMFDSLEHVANLSDVRNICHRSRVVIVSMPQRPSDFPDTMKWKHFRPGEHLHYFSWSSLNEFMRPKRCIVRTNLEDPIRGSRGSEWNIFTSVYRDVSARSLPHHL